MKKEDRYVAENTLRDLFIGSQLDGFKFGVSPESTLIIFTHYNNQEREQIGLLIETRWDAYSPGVETFPENEDEMVPLCEQQKFQLIYNLRRQQVTGIELGAAAPHLMITFESGQVLLINGYHEKYECWQAGDRLGFADSQYLILATPKNGIATFLPDMVNKQLKRT